MGMIDALAAGLGAGLTAAAQPQMQNDLQTQLMQATQQAEQNRQEAVAQFTNQIQVETRHAEQARQAGIMQSGADQAQQDFVNGQVSDLQSALANNNLDTGVDDETKQAIGRDFTPDMKMRAQIGALASAGVEPKDALALLNQDRQMALVQAQMDLRQQREDTRFGELSVHQERAQTYADAQEQKQHFEHIQNGLLSEERITKTIIDNAERQLSLAQKAKNTATGPNGTLSYDLKSTDPKTKSAAQDQLAEYDAQIAAAKADYDKAVAAGVEHKAKAAQFTSAALAAMGNNKTAGTTAIPATSKTGKTYGSISAAIAATGWNKK